MSAGNLFQTQEPAGRDTSRKPAYDGMVWIPGGTFLMGSDRHYPEEAPAHRVTVGGFWMDVKLVTNEEFRAFAKASGYVTVAQRVPDAAQYPGAKPEMLVPGSVVFRKPAGLVDMRNHFNWWTWVSGASWRHPEGPGTWIGGREKHPVVHMALEDVEAYVKWVGKELPTEAEWEFAARGGLDGLDYAWGEEFTPDGKIMANTWQGQFPYENLRTDGYEGTSPVGAFPPNGYGLYDMIGNVWEWTADWYQPHKDIPRSCCANTNPRGGLREKSFDPSMPDVLISRRVIKGGSYLCAKNYCQRYRPAARMAQAIDSGTNHVGFRCIVRP
jgi:formylglycine-generating enzyme